MWFLHIWTVRFTKVLILQVDFSSRSVHNIRIERLWVDVMKGYVGKWVEFFKDLEQFHGLDTNSEQHIWLLHYLFLGMINEDALKWSAAWNQHCMRLPGDQRGGISPLYQFIMGMAENGLRGVEPDDPQYEMDGGEYGVDWEGLQDRELLQNLRERRQRRNEHLEPNPIPAPPRWSRVEVNAPAQSPLNVEQIQELFEYVCGRVDAASVRMDDRRQIWIHALRYFNQLVYL